MGIDKIEEMERKLREEQAMLKARLDARKTGTPTSSLIAPEESKHLQTRSSLSSLSMKHQAIATPVSTQPLETNDLGQVNKDLENVEI